jgi:aryl-alcohol dehydrogenase-like predicted oxidoreductase
MKRRDFIVTLAASGATMMAATNPGQNETRDALGAVLPKRPLGRTGESVTMLGVGGYHVGWTAEKDAQEVIETALAGGVRFFDTAESYQRGESETRYGRFLVPKYREHIFLMTKSTAKTAAELRRHLDDSLRRLQTDFVDLWQVHSLSSPQDVDQRLASGILDVLAEAKANKKTRFVGFTGHSNPEAHLRMLERTTDSNPFDTCQMPINALDPSYHSFTARVLPELQQRRIAVLAMKTLADGRFFGEKRVSGRTIWESPAPIVPNRLSVAEALHFAWSLPISVLITGAETAAMLQEKIGLAKAFTGMTAAERTRVIAKVADLADGKIEYFKRPVTI